MEKIDIVKQIIELQPSVWPETTVSEMRMYHRAYMTDFWARQRRNSDRESPLIEVSQGFRAVEQVVNSLYGRAPAVKISLGVRGMGNARVSEAVANDWLKGPLRQIQEDATRIALIWPFTVYKLTKRHDSKDVWDKVDLTYVLPWDMYLDSRAKHWHQQEYIGDHYWLRLSEAKRRFTKVDLDKWLGVDEKSAPDSFGKDVVDVRPGGAELTDDIGALVHIHEVYFPAENRWCIYSEHYDNGDTLVFDGKMPVKDFSGKSIAPYVPMYFSKDPARPMMGYSALKRVYDQLTELNLDRTALAEQVRKSARMYITPKGTLDDANKRALADGVDGTVIEMDVKPDEIKNSLIAAPVNDLATALLSYAAVIQNDITDASNTADFTRGQDTGVSATEISVLNNYTSNELGRYARTRDESFVNLVRLYLCMLHLFLNKAEAVVLQGKTVVVSPDDVLGDFVIDVSESESTPQARALKKQEIITIIPTLVQLGADPANLLAYVSELFDLPDTLTIVAPAQPDANAFVNGVQNANI